MAPRRSSAGKSSLLCLSMTWIRTLCAVPSLHQVEMTFTSHQSRDRDPCDICVLYVNCYVGSGQREALNGSLVLSTADGQLPLLQSTQISIASGYSNSSEPLSRGNSIVVCWRPVVGSGYEVGEWAWMQIIN